MDVDAPNKTFPGPKDSLCTEGTVSQTPKEKPLTLPSRAAAAHPFSGEITAPSNNSSPTKKRPRAEKLSKHKPNEDHPMVLALRRIDPILIFLTKATGLASIPLPTLKRALPQGCTTNSEAPASTETETAEGNDQILRELESLIRIGVLHLQENDRDVDVTTLISLDWQNTSFSIGFPLPQSSDTNNNNNNNALLPGDDAWREIRQRVGAIHGSTKTAARKRLRALQLYLKQCQWEEQDRDSTKTNSENNTKSTVSCIQEKETATTATKKQVGPRKVWEQEGCVLCTPPSIFQEERFLTPTQAAPLIPDTEEAEDAMKALRVLLGFPSEDVCGGEKSNEKEKECTKQHPSLRLLTRILPNQVSHAGSQPAQSSVFGEFSESTAKQIPTCLWNAFGLRRDNSTEGRRLYAHQVRAIEAAMDRKHTTVCTGTGSGKSLCFLLPVLTQAYQNPSSFSIILFPTKALAQDQSQKLYSLLENSTPDMQQRIRISTLDGDTLHSERTRIVKSEPNILLTNPDTLHAAILPGWKATYKPLFAGKELSFVVLDEAHLYDGVFGSHVALVLARLLRVAAMNRPVGGRRTTFFASSATMPFPLEHFCRLFPIDGQNDPVSLITEDTSPRAAKHFFAWNPPLMSKRDGLPLERVTFPRPKLKEGSKTQMDEENPKVVASENDDNTSVSLPPDTNAEDQRTAYAPTAGNESKTTRRGSLSLYRRHAADETALLFVKAIQQGTRCIAFAKTRNLVEWIYEKALNALGGDSKLKSKIESYRGGYSAFERKKIEDRLFANDLIGVVATNALELGVDVGGIDLSLHCGYPSSLASLYQQAGRAGRGTNIDRPSCAVVVCFNSPLEQYLWKTPSTLLAKSCSPSSNIPMSQSLVQGHLLCASDEIPLTGDAPVSISRDIDTHSMLSDHDLFGGEEVYEESFSQLLSSGSLICIPCNPVGEGSEGSVKTFKSRQKKAWVNVSIRSIEPINFSVVDLSHPQQGGRTDTVHPNAVLDTVPFSRVFWHCHPGAIISHRGAKYKITSMTRPPPFAAQSFYQKNQTFASFARPTNARYITRPLSLMQITVIKQLERVDFPREHGKEVRPKTATTNLSNGVDDEMAAACSFAGCGAVSVKRTVHGYKKLSLINRSEIGRSEINLPDLEFDSFGLWIDTDAGLLRPLLGEKYGEGVHALEHAMLAVAPLCVPGLTRKDLECDHSSHAPTRIVLFDERAGSSGATNRLWKQLFKPNNVLEAALKLLENCPSCGWDINYDGGCPACLLAPECLKFNMNMSRSAALKIGKRMLSRLQQTELFKQNSSKMKETGDTSILKSPKPLSLTPRKRARQEALRQAKELRPAQDRQFIVGRPSWPGEDPANPNGGRRDEND